MQVNIELERCVCIHSLSQIVDITLQVLLYQRRIIPLPVQNLLIESNKKSAKFKNSYQEVSFVFFIKFTQHIKSQNVLSQNDKYF